MSILQSIRPWLAAADSRPAHEIDQEIADELEFHLQMRTEENVLAGMSPPEARAAAIERFGDIESIRKVCRTTLLGERIMLHRLQYALIGILLVAVVVLAYQMYGAKLAMAEANDRLARAQRAAAAAQPQQHSVATLPPVVVKTVPQAGDTEVDSNITEIRVTYSKKMLDKSWSWGQISDDTFPALAGEPRYLDDGKTCVLPVKLEPGRTYVLQLNSLKGAFANFKDEQQRPAVPYLLVFETTRP